MAASSPGPSILVGNVKRSAIYEMPKGRRALSVAEALRMDEITLVSDSLLPHAQ